MKKVGGITFARLGRIQVSFCICRNGSDAHWVALYLVALAAGAIFGVTL